MKNLMSLSIIFLFISVSLTVGQNPLVKDIGMSDPHVRVFNDTVYLYCGHDSSANDKIWTMKDWRIFSSDNLVDWKFRYTISPENNYMDNNTTDCWAGDAAFRNGKYYFYFSDRKRGVGVMVSDAPTGPFRDPLGKPLVAPMHDPTIMIDDDKNKTPYICYGDKAGGGFHIAKLNEDMISLAESPKPIQIKGKEWEKAPEWMDKNYLFKRNGTYYLSWGRDYAISKNIYGPYNCVGAVGEGHYLSEYAHGSFFEWKGQFYHVWCYYIKPGFRYRETIMTYCHFDNNGNIVTDTKFLDKHFSYGVARYDASWEKIEAEWYYEKSPTIQKKGSIDKGFNVLNIKNKDWLRFSNVTFNESLKQFSASISGEKGTSATLSIHLDSLSGEKAGEINFEFSDEINEIRTFTGAVNIEPGIRDIYLIFKGKQPFNISCDWIRFH